MCAALDYAHRKTDLDGQPMNIIHRDVSPRNILISYSGEVKLTDFGIARARDREEHTEHGVIKGKVRYISPEAAAGKPVDGRSDLYSLGALLYVTATSGLGLLMSTFTKSQVAAIFGTAIATMTPAFAFSGLNSSVTALEGGAAVFSSIYPTTHFLVISQGAFTGVDSLLGFHGLRAEI